MKVAITSQGADLDSEVDPRFGRAMFFIVVDTETGEFTAHDNEQNLSAAQGAGIQAAQNVVSFGVDGVVTGNVGPKAFTALQAGNIKIYVGAAGSVMRAVEQFKTGQLECVNKPNVEGHWM
jgi:predicted Fe-Mo cluster-binding NifX family protein